MGGLAQLAAEKGIKVSGCDENVYPPMDQVLLSNGITIDEGYNPKNLPKDVDLVVVGNVIARGNPMIEEILNKGIDFISGPEFLSKYLLAYFVSFSFYFSFMSRRSFSSLSVFSLSLAVAHFLNCFLEKARCCL